MPVATPLPDTRGRKHMAKKDVSTRDQRSAKTDPQRRNVVKLLAAGGLGAITSPWVFQSSSRAAGRPIKIGMVSPSTGPIAAFGEADQWVLAEAKKTLAKGITVAGETHPVEIIYRDSQSNANRASEVTAQLINRDKVDMMIASSTGDTVIPVADQCELAGTPCITADDPWEDFFFGRKGNPQKGFDWTFHFFWGFGMVADLFADMWLSIETNKKVGLMLTNDQDGIAASNPEHGIASHFKKKGLT